MAHRERKGGMMNVLDKILGEIDKKADYYECGEQGREHIRMVDMVEVEEIIRSHIDEIPKCEECSRRKWCQIGYRDGENDVENNGWIPVEERLPEEGKEVLAQFVIRVRNMNNKVNEEVYIYPLRYEKGTWQSFAGVPNGEVEAWQPLPDPYKPEEDKP